MPELVNDASCHRAIEQACDACEAELQARPEVGMTWRVVFPRLELSGIASVSGSLWVFAFAPHGRSEIHKHSNSTQYTRAWRGQGTMRIGDPAQPADIYLPRAAEPDWVVIPMGVFHEAVAGADGWCVVSFQTVPAAELQEEPVAGAARHYAGEQ
ncbi:MAG TPA: hypothetical protein VNQ79_05515 [Blastocatellia bacterium]|nr:hypothetical protein [Blastocatellia bacterium]